MGKITAIVLTALFTTIAAIAVMAVISFTSSPSSSKAVVIIDVPPGSSFTSVSKTLQNNGMIHNELLFKVYAKLLGYTTSLKVGEYELRKNMSPKEILTTLNAGKSIVYPVTVPEGFNTFEIEQILRSRWPDKADRFAKLVRDRQFIRELLQEDVASLEGYLFPDTYNVTKYMNSRQLITAMVRQFLLAYEKVPDTSIKRRMSRHDIVTLASIIEKETGAPQERPLIASVFHNRLAKGMRLQSDPTIIYGVWIETGEYLKNIKRVHLTTSTPYNTYTVKALPAGPIANPGLDSLVAVVQPATSKFFYFVSRNDGTHIFSETYEQHNKAVRNFQLNRKAREGKSWRK